MFHFHWQQNNCYLCDTKLLTNELFHIDLSLVAKYMPKLVKKNVQRTYTCTTCRIHFKQYHARRLQWDKNVNHLRSLKNCGLTATLNNFINSTQPICNLCHNKTALRHIIPINHLEDGITEMVVFHSGINDLKILDIEPVICTECFDVIETFNSFYHMCINSRVKTLVNGNVGLTQPGADELMLGSDELLKFDVVDILRDTSQLIDRGEHALPCQTAASLSQKKIKIGVVNPSESVNSSPVVKATPVTLPLSPDAIIVNVIDTVSKQNETPNMEFKKLKCKSISDKHPKTNNSLLTNKANRNNKTVGTDIAETIMNSKRIKWSSSETGETKDTNTKKIIQSANDNVDIPNETISNTPCEDSHPVIEINMTKVSELFTTGFKGVDKRTDDIISILNEKKIYTDRDELLDFQGAIPVVQMAEKLSPSHIKVTTNYPSKRKTFTSAYEDFIDKRTREKCCLKKYSISKLQL